MNDENDSHESHSELGHGFGDLGGWSFNHALMPWAPDGSLLFGPCAPDRSLLFGQVEGAADHHILQATDFTCAVVCQQMLLRDYGVELGESELVFEATSHGWLTRHGTTPEDVGKLLELHGVETHILHGGSVRQLADELAHGHKVIAALDSGELWGTDTPFEDWMNPQGADHAVVITGLDMSDPQHPLICLNDPGDPHGAGRTYPLDHFLKAWEDSGRMFVATDESPANLAQHPHYGANFDADAGIYLDMNFWETLVMAIVQAIDPTFDPSAFLPTTGPKTRASKLDTLTDDQRDNLFLQL